MTPIKIKSLNEMDLISVSVYKIGFNKPVKHLIHKLAAF